MFLRSLAVLSLTSTLVLGLTACGDDKNDDTTTITSTNPTNPSGASQSDTSAATDPATDGTGETTNIVTGSASEGTDTTANPSEVTTTVSTTVSTTTPDDTSGETGPDPSATESATTDPATTDPTVGTSTTGDPGVPGSLYGPCDDGMPPCQDGADCLSIMGLEGNFCSPSCAMMAACPANPSGDAMAQCALTMEGSEEPVNCALVCMLDTPGQCPGGTSCKQLPPPNEMFGLCTAP